MSKRRQVALESLDFVTHNEWSGREVYFYNLCFKLLP